MSQYIAEGLLALIGTLAVAEWARADLPNAARQATHKGVPRLPLAAIAAAWRAGAGRDLDLHELRHACATLLLERGLAPADVAVQLRQRDGGRLVMTLYGHPDEDRARDRLDLAFAADGHKQSGADDRPGHNSAISRDRIS